MDKANIVSFPKTYTSPDLSDAGRDTDAPHGPINTGQAITGQAITGQAIAGLSQVVLTRNGKRLLDGLNLDIRDTCISVLMGPNGAGKTLALRLMARLLEPDQGVVHHCGLEQRDLAIVFQKPVLLRRSVAGNLHHALKLRGHGRLARKDLVTQWLQTGQLEAQARQAARRLSAGEQQRLAMVRALAMRPKLLFLDEPTANLDPAATGRLEALIQEAARQGVKIVLITHDAGQARRLADDIHFMAAGRLVERSDAPSFFTAPQSTEAAAYLEGRLLL